MKIIQARVLLNYTIDELWESLAGRFKLKFDDGEIIETDYKETLYTAYFWTFHKRYPNTPLLAKHHLRSILGQNKYLNNKSHVKLLKNIYWDVVDTYKAHTPKERDVYTKTIYEIVNYIYNDLPPRIDEYMLTLDALDFVNLAIHPHMANILDQVEETKESINKSHKEIMDLLNKDESLSENSIVKCVRYGSVNKNQVLQVVGPRGFVSEVDSEVLGRPITRSFTQGMRTLYNISAESRSVAKSLYYSETPLQKSEYFARKLQLLSMTIERIHYCDCGSKEYLYWKVKGPEYSDTNPDQVTYKGDLPNLVGKYYLLAEESDDTPLKVIKVSDTHLIGKTIKMRSPLHCKHPDKAGVCEICFGEMAYNLPQNGNLGHNCAASFTSVISQSVLSTKHLDASSKSETIHLTRDNMKFFNIDKNRIFYSLKKGLSKFQPKIIVAQNNVPGLTDILMVDNIKDMTLSHISSLENFNLILKEEDGTLVNNTITVSQGKKRPVFTYDFLNYIKRYKWKLEGARVIFDLTMWDYDKPIMKLPEVEYNFSHYQSRVEKLIKSKHDPKDKDKIHDLEPVELVAELFDTINRKQSINIALMEIIVYALMTTDPEKGYYGLARHRDKPVLSVYPDTIMGRSLSAVYAYENQEKAMVRSTSFYQFDRPDHILDVFIAPNEVLNSIRKYC